MEGKLKKIGNEYKLYAQDDSCIATTHESPYKKLSLKNCEAIANGYDLMMLAEEDSNKYYDVKTTDWHCNYNGFFGGFKKALEILSDKKFSEEDVKIMFQLGFNLDNAISRNEYNTHIQSLQQTEWDVTFNPDEKDSEDCLILKRL